MLLAILFDLFAVECAHPRHIIPYPRRAGGTPEGFKRRGQTSALFHGLRRIEVCAVIVDHRFCAFVEQGIDRFEVVAFELLIRQEAVAGTVPLCPRVDLPLSARVLRLLLADRKIGISFGVIRREFPEEEQIFRTSDSHFGSVLALLAPAEPVSLIVLADHIGFDRDHSEKLEAVLEIVECGIHVERIDRRHSRSGYVPEQNTVFDMHDCAPDGIVRAGQIADRIPTADGENRTGNEFLRL